MARFYEKEDGEEYWFETKDGLNMQLNEDNVLIHLHETVDDEMSCQPTADWMFDRLAVLDPRDNEYWIYFRADFEDDFPQLEFIARKVGTVLIRQTVLPMIMESFERNHLLTDNEMERFLEG